MNQVEELRRVVRGYRSSPPRNAPAGLLDALRKLGDEVGPGDQSRAHIPAGGNLEQDLRDVARRLLKEGGVSNLAGLMLNGVLAELGTPGRPSTVSTGEGKVIDAQPLPTGQIPNSSTGNFPDPS